MPAYPRMSLLDDAKVASIPHRLDVRYADQVELLGYGLDHPSIRPGEPLEVTLYWRSLAPAFVDYTVFVHAFDAWGTELGGFDDVLEKKYPTSAWLAGDSVKETYILQLREPNERPSSVRIEVGLYAYPSMERLAASDASGKFAGTTVTIARVKAPGPAAQPPAMGKEISLEDGLALVAYQGPAGTLRPGQFLEGRLWWKASAPAGRDYTVFVQLLGPGGLVAQYDAQPRADTYPTSLWDAGEIVEDYFRLAVPQQAAGGVYRLIAGMYDSSSGARLRSGGSDHVVLSELSMEAGVPAK